MISRILLLGFFIEEFFRLFGVGFIAWSYALYIISFPSDLLTSVMHKHRVVDPPCF